MSPVFTVSSEHCIRERDYGGRNSYGTARNAADVGQGFADRTDGHSDDTDLFEQSDRTSGRIAMLVIHAVYPEYDRYPEKEQRKVYDDIQFLVRKAAHFTEYLVLGIMIRLCIESWFGKKRFLNTTGWVYGTLYACTDELHQLLTDGRSGQWQDVLLDSCGVLAGVLITALIRRRRERKAGKSQCP